MQGQEIGVEVKLGGTRCNGSNGPCRVETINNGNAIVWLNNNEFKLKISRAKLT
jgi:hypothetical protein